MSDGIFTRQRQRVHCWQTAPPPLTDVGDKQEQLKGEHTPRKSGWEGLKMTDFCFHQTFVVWFPTCRESRSWDLESETQRSVFFFLKPLKLSLDVFLFYCRHSWSCSNTLTCTWTRIRFRPVNVQPTSPRLPISVWWCWCSYVRWRHCHSHARKG